MDSSEYYNSIAGDYEEVYSQRFLYHKAIDDCIRNNTNFLLWENVLDVGSGKGERLANLFCDHSARISCVENSNEMAKELGKNSRIAKVFQEDFCLMKKESFDTPFDLVLLQWNVFGHLTDPAKAIATISSVCKTGSCLIFDINNPLNIVQYGIKNVVKNIFAFVRFSERNELSFQIVHNGISTKTKFFRLKYLRKLLNSNGFEVKSLKYFSYSSGKPTNFLAGQVFIEAVKV